MYFMYESILCMVNIAIAFRKLITSDQFSQILITGSTYCTDIESDANVPGGFVDWRPGILLFMRPPNERRRYIGWAHAQRNLWQEL